MVLLLAALFAGCDGSNELAVDAGPMPYDGAGDLLPVDAKPPPPDAELIEPASWPKTSSADRAAILQLMKTEKTPGLAACLVKSGKIVWCDGFGLADITRNVPVTRDTPFLLCSTTKPVTAVAVLQLRDSGAFTLDDDADKLLPFAVDHPASAAPITLRQLLRHTSGIKDNWTMMNKLYGYPTKPGGGAVPPMSLAAAMKSYYTPGEALYMADNFLAVGPDQKWTYSNMGVALAGYVAEVAAEQDYADLYAKQIFTPLGMDNSGFRWKDLGGVEVAVPYSWKTGQGYVTRGHYTFSDAPNGGLRSSARDMARFLAAIMRGGELGGARILKASTVTEMLAVQDAELKSNWGLSWYTHSFLGKTWIGHGGDESDAAADMAYSPADKVGYVILRNFPRGSADKQIKAQIIGMAGSFSAP